MLVILLLALNPTKAQRINTSSQEQMLQLKNYYLLSLLEQAPLKSWMLQQQKLAEITEKRKTNLLYALKNCSDVACLVKAMQLSEKEIETVAHIFDNAYAESSLLHRLVKEQLIPSKRYNQYAQEMPEKLLTQALKQDLEGLNYTIAVYGEGKAPNYPKIDSIAFNVNSKQYQNLLYDVVASIVDQPKELDLFFSCSLISALRLLEINERQEAAAYEPLTETENRLALDNVKTTDWNKFPYTLILIPGAGPEEPNVALSAEGMLRCRVAANRYREGLAPFIMVSGGNVHPYKTKFNEAVEMKKYLVEKMKVPEDAILIEPHARHTTTNMRNCARIMYTYGFPMNKWAVTSTDRSQSYYISKMEARCMKELGYVPYKLGKRLSDTEQEFMPLEISLRINPYEPLDP